MADSGARDKKFGEISMLEEVHNVRLENPSPLWENLDEAPPTKLTRDALMREHQAIALLSSSVINVSEMLLYSWAPDSNGDDGFRIMESRRQN